MHHKVLYWECFLEKEKEREWGEGLEVGCMYMCVCVNVYVDDMNKKLLFTVILQL